MPTTASVADLERDLELERARVKNAEDRLTAARRSAGMSSPGVKLVRIHPFDPDHGYSVRQYLLGGTRYPKFIEGRGWAEVDEVTARRLADVRTNPQDPRSTSVFEVVDPETAKALDEVEEEQVAKATKPIPLPPTVRALGANRPAPVRRERALAPVAEPVEPEAAANDLTTADLAGTPAPAPAPAVAWEPVVAPKAPAAKPGKPTKKAR